MDSISVRGARTHNLKNISLDIPRGRLVVITGLSGSGKSSLAFDTLYAEGERRYVESLSADARQFLERLPRAEVDQVTGLPPAIAIDQRSAAGGARSTVGSVTETEDYLRLLFARSGTPHCPRHGVPLEAKSVAAMTDELILAAEEKRVLILAPVWRRRQVAAGEARALFSKLLAEGYQRVRVGDEVMMLDDLPQEDFLADGEPHDLAVVVDRLRVRADQRERIAESLENAAGLAGGLAAAADMDGDWSAAWSVNNACPFCDFAAGELEPRNFSRMSPKGACPACHGTGLVDEEPCPACSGSGLSEVARNVRVAGLTIADLMEMPVEDLRGWLAGLELPGIRGEAARRIIAGAGTRLACLADLGLGYLTLGRRASTLSGGERQRIRLAGQIGSGLSGVLYVLDEPSIGLHPADGERLIRTLKGLRDLGNTVLVVEHDAEMMRAADRIIDMGPGAGELGGRVVAEGSPGEVMANPDSVTGAYLSGRRTAVPERPAFAAESSRWLRLTGASGRTLRNVTLEIPVGALTVVTGPSGSGKSTLISDTLAAAAAARLNRAEDRSLPFESIEGLEAFDRAVVVDQSPLGRNARSNTATATGLFAPVRELMAQTLTARERGYGAARFSFNQKGGRCEACGGEGEVRIEMQFLPDLTVPCDVCGGKRYNRETLECRWKGLSIADILDLTVDEALEKFSAHPQMRPRLTALADTGLGYLRLGQSAATLSGGEAQRVRLATELAKRSDGRTLYILDEPTTGLHFEDTAKLLAAIRRLTAAGSTVLIVEHDLDVIAAADWVIDMGPGGGESGGRIVAAGTPEAVAADPESPTGPWLARAL
ncbi:excinuclease ABC subunit UvrA [Sutterella sp.]|uniref:excinuclease ABC subunit UvrA n=1 Tax=Sutterella sp. TaxID=1981025 RepID=UPI0026DF8F92|nr:excinuclease ABC subunit UvrA [Sutterella sp.]MDO5530675.1 excinuclease ABC subunit UvrA [Sutterella sp.]